jgi:endonuclease YncB( thermonuclease family)
MGDLSFFLSNGGSHKIATFKDRRDKYGRYVADVVIVNHHGFAAWLSDEMLRLGNVVEYMQ